MAVYFLDTSAVVKRYVLETGTAWVQALTAPAAGHVLCVARITRPETVAAVKWNIWFRKSESVPSQRGGQHRFVRDPSAASLNFWGSWAK